MHRSRSGRWLAGASAATILLLITPATVLADDHGEQAEDAHAAMEARVQALENAVAALTSALEAERVRNAAVQSIPQQVDGLEGELATQRGRLDAQEERLGKTERDGFQSGNARIKFGGFVKVDGVYTRANDGDLPMTGGGGNASREFYIPGAIPVGGSGSDPVFTGHAKQTRISMTVTPEVPGAKVGAYFEGDFESAAGTQGTQVVTNAYDFAMRRAFVTYDNWLIGQEFSTFMNLSVFPETTDFIGNTEAMPFVRQPMVRYTHNVSDTVNLQFALENPETNVFGVNGAPSGFQDAEGIPDIVGKASFKVGSAALSASAIVRSLSVDRAGFDESALGWGLSFAGKIPFGVDGKNDIRFVASHGDGIGRYLNLAFAPDAYAVGGANPDLETISVTSGGATARLMLGGTLRTNLGLNYITVDQDATLAVGTLNESAWSAFANLFFTPVKGMDVGVEYRRGNREIVSGADGSIDRLHFVVKRGF